ncbi:MAG: c-type cytochrome [Bacteroidota bacterium]|nr:c-type cytochrome [Bacteroidota bacterium]MDP4216652.1 c-type cytochrome [Bacteroidota bacterium]MDP4245325.1 c-type cytochrome [Bacteroidota bacterium]MDP4253368.1 c-type cytochrome [Bacteroidota bacterium]MDP4260652.1 c-type cytochrome [Bacteroidota bacterium]
MLPYKKIAVALCLFAFMAIGMAATRPADPARPASQTADRIFKNLKILPKDISKEDLGKTMDLWKNALGVKCGFCHAPTADSTSHHLDFASDAKPEKNIARHMYKMTAKINKKYFSFNKDEQGNTMPAVACMTCHRGSPHPEAK